MGCFFFGVIGSLAFLGLNLALFAVAPLGTQNGLTADGAIVDVHKGIPPHELARLLVANHVLAEDDEAKFVWLGRILRQWRRLKAGEYKFTPTMTRLEIFATLGSGISVAHPITVREGENIYEIGADIESHGLGKKETFVFLCKSPKVIHSLLGADSQVLSLEGYLFPDTYFFNKTMTQEEMIRQMYHHFAAVWTPEFDARAKSMGMTRYQALTLASMIEKETGAPSERPIISSVFHNRLHKGMKLQSDPTTIYGIWSRYHGNIHKTDLSDPSPYNTYYVPALPVGPISNPGIESIRAALYPAQSDFLFFVSHNDGTHQFSRSYEEHTSAVKKFQLDPKAREGKSWRDLYNKSHPPHPS